MEIARTEGLTELSVVSVDVQSAAAVNFKLLVTLAIGEVSGMAAPVFPRMDVATLAMLSETVGMFVIRGETDPDLAICVVSALLDPESLVVR